MTNADSADNTRFYTFVQTPELQSLLQRAEELKARIDQLKEREEIGDLWETIQRKLKIDWTYNTNAIEGSTLTLGETLFFLQQGLTVEGKPLKDFLDARNHAEAVDFLYEVVVRKLPISTSLIKQINALLLLGITSTPAVDQFGQRVKKPATPGEYKKLPNHVIQPDGTIHRYTDPIQVPSEMEQLVHWINANIDLLHPCLVGAIAHYNMVRIHPFDDGNGRGARILMNLILLRKHYPPAVIRVEERRTYIHALKQADEGDLSDFITFVAQSLLRTEEIILQDLDRP